MSVGSKRTTDICLGSNQTTDIRLQISVSSPKWIYVVYLEPKRIYVVHLEPILWASVLHFNSTIIRISLLRLSPYTIPYTTDVGALNGIGMSKQLMT